MELNEIEKRLIFQTEGYGKSDVTYELRMCLSYIKDTASMWRLPGNAGLHSRPSLGLSHVM